MRYAVLLGISSVGEVMTMGEAVVLASKTSLTNPLRLVRIIDTHSDVIVWRWRNGEPTFEPEGRP
jgi:hypothetical protein